jgi:hypothetical protein
LSGRPRAAVPGTADELRQLVSEAHAARRDLEIERRRVKATWDEIHEDVASQIQELVKAEMDRACEILSEHTDKAVIKVYKRFSELADLMLGMSRKQKTNGGLDLPQIVEAWAATVDESQQTFIAGGGSSWKRV